MLSCPLRPTEPCSLHLLVLAQRLSTPSWSGCSPGLACLREPSSGSVQPPGLGLTQWGHLGCAHRGWARRGDPVPSSLTSTLPLSPGLLAEAEMTRPKGPFRAVPRHLPSPSLASPPLPCRGDLGWARGVLGWAWAGLGEMAGRKGSHPLPRLSSLSLGLAL